MSARPPLDDSGFFFCGLDTDGKAAAFRQEQAVSSRAGNQPALQVFGQIKGVSNGADSGGILLEKKFEGGVLEQCPTGVAGDGAGCVLGQEILDVLGDELKSEAVLAGAFGHARP